MFKLLRDNCWQNLMHLQGTFLNPQPLRLVQILDQYKLSSGWGVQNWPKLARARKICQMACLSPKSSLLEQSLYNFQYKKHDTGTGHLVIISILSAMRKLVFRFITITLEQFQQPDTTSAHSQLSQHSGIVSHNYTNIEMYLPITCWIGEGG